MPGVAVRVVNATAEWDGSSFGLCGAHVWRLFLGGTKSRRCACAAAGVNRPGCSMGGPIKEPSVSFRSGRFELGWDIWTMKFREGEEWHIYVGVCDNMKSMVYTGAHKYGDIGETVETVKEPGRPRHPTKVGC